jgi:hypothetical protein
MVVACEVSSPCSPGGNGRRPGIRSGAAMLRKSVKELVPTA